jgi:hypothetical protein
MGPEKLIQSGGFSSGNGRVVLLFNPVPCFKVKNLENTREEHFH